MSSLLDKFCSLLPEGLSTKYSTAKLQTRLQNHYGDTIVIESQKGQGQSNIVFSNSISAADAIRAASKLKADLKFSEVEASFVDVSAIWLPPSSYWRLCNFDFCAACPMNSEAKV